MGNLTINLSPEAFDSYHITYVIYDDPYVVQITILLSLLFSIYLYGKNDHNNPEFIMLIVLLCIGLAFSFFYSYHSLYQ